MLLSVVAAACACERDAKPRTSAAETPPPSILEGGTERPEKLIVGLTPFLPAGKLNREFEPLAEHIGKVIGVPAEVRRAKDYADVSQLLRTYQIHVAVLSPFAYVRAKRENPNLILLATQIADGSSTYAGYITVRDDSGIDSVEGLRGKRFAFVDRNSASGYVYPLAYLRSAGIEPERAFGSIEFAGNHQAVLSKVLSGEVDAGAVTSVVYRMALSEAKDGKRLKILAKTGRIPHDAYCASPRLDQELVTEIRSLLLNLNTRTDEGRRVLSGLTSINGFVAVGDDHYDEVRRVERLIQEGGPAAP